MSDPKAKFKKHVGAESGGGRPEGKGYITKLLRYIYAGRCEGQSFLAPFSISLCRPVPPLKPPRGFGLHSSPM